MMVLRTSVSTLLLALTLNGCAPHPIFPNKFVQGTDVDFDFAAWVKNPSTRVGDKVEVGGRIIQAIPVEGGLLIVGEQLPIVEHPAYGPTERTKRTGMFEFAFLFPGKIEPGALFRGNRFILVGTTQGTKTVEVEGSMKSEPYLKARCVHIWKTEGSEISEFPYVGAGYYPLEEQTYCTTTTGNREQ